MQCLVEVARNYYDFLQNDIEKIFSIMKDYVYYLIIQAYEFWSSISEEEISRSKNKIYNKTLYGYCDFVWSELLTIVFSHLKNRTDMQDDEWNLVKAGSTVVAQFSQVVTNFQFIERVIDFVGSNIKIILTL
jgi:hypothetical protein